MTTDGQKVVVNDRAALATMAQSLQLPIKCFVVFSPKEFRIQIISFKNIFFIYTIFYKKLGSQKNCLKQILIKL